MEALEDEIQVVQAVYSSEGEFELLSKGEANIGTTVLRLNLRVGESSLSLTVSLPSGYPEIPVEVSVSSRDLTNRQSIQLKQDLLHYCTRLIGQPMVLEIASWTKDNFPNYQQPEVKDKTVTDDGANDLYTCLLHLDHMRAKSRYVKTIKKWIEELSLSGRLVFFGKLILIVLQGRLCDIKEYVHKQRTVNVDVDSKGRSCKERMLTVLAEEPVSSQSRCKEFGVEEVQSLQELDSLFESVKLKSIFEEYVMALIKS